MPTSRVQNTSIRSPRPRHPSGHKTRAYCRRALLVSHDMLELTNILFSRQEAGSCQGRHDAFRLRNGSRRCCLSSAGHEAKALSQRAQIILAAFDGWLNEDIAFEVGLNRKQVDRWRRRSQNAWDKLTRLECMEPSKLKAAIRQTLADAPRSDSPGKFTAAQVCGILAVACERPTAAHSYRDHERRFQTSTLSGIPLGPTSPKLVYPRKLLRS